MLNITHVRQMRGTRPPRVLEGERCVGCSAGRRMGGVWAVVRAVEWEVCGLWSGRYVSSCGALLCGAVEWTLETAMFSSHYIAVVWPL